METDTVSINNEEYSYSDLQDLIGRGKMAREIETKQNTKLDRLMPEYTKATQRLKEIEPKLQEYESKIKEYEERMNPKQQGLSDDEKIATLQRAAELGLVTEKTLADKVQGIIDARVQLHLQAQEKVRDTSNAIGDFSREYGLEATTEDVINFMVENGIKNPKLALKEMFDSRISEIETERRHKAEEDGFMTQPTSGAKQYRSDIDYKDKTAVQKAIREALRGE